MTLFISKVVEYITVYFLLSFLVSDFVYTLTKLITVPIGAVIHVFRCHLINVHDLAHPRVTPLHRQFQDELVTWTLCTNQTETV